MATEEPETDAFLAVLEAKIAALLTLKESYLRAVSLGALGQRGELNVAGFTTPLGTKSDAPIELPQGALLGKSLPAAIKLYLSAVRKKQTTREITIALKEGGVESTAANFENNVTSSLHRLRATGEVLKFSDGWGLAEFYPENLRNRIAAKSDAKPKGLARKAKRPKQSASKATTRTKVVPVGGPSIDALIASYVGARPMQVFSSAELGKAVNEPDVKRVAMALARLQGRGKLIKRKDGGFSAPRTVEHMKAV